MLTNSIPGGGGIGGFPSQAAARPPRRREAGLYFGLLGPLLVRAGEPPVPVTVSAGKQRALLAALLVRANQIVPPGYLAEVVWEGSPPKTARVTLQNYVMRLRQSLGSAGRELIMTRPAGYLIEAGADDLDVIRFGVLQAAGRAAARAGAWETASQHLTSALSLWRGEPLADVPSQVLALAHIPRLAEMRLDALEARIDADLHLGLHREVVTELKSLATDEPLRERLHGLLMLALYRSGQQAAALAAYRQLRRQLLDELGIDPSPGLRKLNQQILQADPKLRFTPPAAAGRPGQPGARPSSQDADTHHEAGKAMRPAMLPAAVPGFTGRAAELATLAALSGADARSAADAPPSQPATSVVITAIGGTAGVGKTALALHWAHRVAGLFPDGQLYVNLHGFDASAPAPPGQALGWFLEALGVAAQAMPASLEARAALYRSLVAGRRLLIVVDNARDCEQVRPLLPGAPGCLVVVTSRASLAGLAVSESAHLLTLDVLSGEEARALLERRIGSARAAAEPGAVRELTRLCAGLPLALAIVAARACACPGFPLASLAAELGDESGQLDALDTADPASSIQAVFSWSYQRLTGPAARMFRLLALHPGPDVTAPAAASAAGVPQPTARRCLRELTHASLLSEHLPGRFAFHDLLRAYAASEAAAEDQQARHEATGRILDHYRSTAAEAAFLINPAHGRITAASPRPGVTPEPLAGHKQALGWLHAEYQVLLAAAVLAGSSGFDMHAWQIPWATAKFMAIRCHWRDMATAQGTALAAATRLGDTAAQAESLRLLAFACAQLGDHDQARAHYTASLTLFQQAGDHPGQARVHQYLGVLALRQGRYADALTSSEQALRLYQATGDRAGEAAALNNAGYFRALLGDYRQARAACRNALSLAAELGLRYGEANAWDSLGYAEQHLGNLGEATACYQQALAIAREFGDRYTEATILTHLGDTHHARGEHQQAQQAWLQALDILTELHHPDTDQLRRKLQSLA